MSLKLVLTVEGGACRWAAGRNSGEVLNGKPCVVPYTKNNPIDSKNSIRSADLIHEIHSTITENTSDRQSNNQPYSHLQTALLYKIFLDLGFSIYAFGNRKQWAADGGLLAK